MSTGSFPHTESGWLTWSGVFLAGITANTEALNLEASQVTQYTGYRADFLIKHGLASDPATRTKTIVFQKNEALKLLASESRALGMYILKNPLVPSALKLNLGLHLPKPRQSAEVPTSVPVVTAKQVGPRSVNVRLRDDLTGRRALPSGVSGANFYVAVADQQPTDASAYVFLGAVTRTTCCLDVSPHMGEAAGRLWICASWFNSKAQTGFTGAAVPIDLPAALPLPAGNGVNTTQLRVAA